MCVNHSKNYSSKDVISIKFLHNHCRLHNTEAFIGYCNYCKVQFCKDCKQHKNHNTSFFYNIKPENEEIEEYKKNIIKPKKSLLYDLKKFINILEAEIKIDELFIDSYNENEDNYYLIQNINELLKNKNQLIIINHIIEKCNEILNYYRNFQTFMKKAI